MAGDWFAVDHDLPDKPEVLQIIEATGEGVEVVVFRLLMLWRMADRQSTNGRLNGVGFGGLSCRLGGSKNFWAAVAEAGWLTVEEGSVVIPRFEERFGQSAKTRMLTAKRVSALRERYASVTPTLHERSQPPQPQPPPQPQSEPPPPPPPPSGVLGGGDGDGKWEEARKTALDTCRQLGAKPPATGKYRRLIIQAAWLSLNKLDRTWLEDAVEDTRRRQPQRVWAYFRACLASGCVARGHDLEKLLLSVSVPTRFLTSKEAEITT
jgi:hypothetical protein